MRIKLTPATPSRQVVSKTSGKPFHITQAEAVDDGGDWKTCRWTIIGDRPIPAVAGEFQILEYNAQKGEGRARPVVG